MRVKHIKFNLPVIFFQEDKKIIAYTPALDLSTCGNNFNHAKKRFEEMLDIFFKETEDIKGVLLECGWKKVTRPPGWIPPIYLGEIQEEVSIPMSV